MNPLLISLLAGLSTLLGCIPIFIKVKKVGEFITFSLSLSMTIMILISILDLIPNSIPIMIKEYNYLGIIIAVLIFLLGYLFIYIIENRVNNSNNSLKRIGFLSMISLILHNIPEGLIVYMSAYANISLGIKMFIAIVLHNIPEGIAISIPFYYSGESRGSVFKKVLLASISEPLGALLSLLFINRGPTNLLLSYMLLFVSGLMISLSINDIYIEIKKYNLNKYIIYGILLGIFLTILLSLL